MEKIRAGSKVSIFELEKQNNELFKIEMVLYFHEKQRNN